MTSVDIARRTCSAILSVVLLGACATGTVRDGAPMDAAESSAAEPAASGSAVALAESGLRVVDDYFAASGRTCRRLADEDGRLVARVSCLQSNGTWTLGRSLRVPGPDGVAAADGEVDGRR